MQKKDIDIDRLTLKRTFEDVLNAQEEIRDTLQDLIKENRCLTKEERGVFLRQLAHATLGLGREHPYNIIISEYTGDETLGSVEFIARRLCMETENVLKYKRQYDYSRELKEFVIPISKFWEALLYGLFDVFPLALDRASAMSKEMDATTGGAAYEFNPKERNPKT